MWDTGVLLVPLAQSARHSTRRPDEITLHELSGHEFDGAEPKIANATIVPNLNLLSGHESKAQTWRKHQIASNAGGHQGVRTTEFAN